jgi:hypothetical protein
MIARVPPDGRNVERDRFGTDHSEIARDAKALLPGDNEVE